MSTNQASVTFFFEKSIQDSIEFNEEYANFLRKVRSMEDGTYTREIVQQDLCLSKLLTPEKHVLTECFQTMYNTVQKVSNNTRSYGDVIEAVEFFVGMLRYIDGEILKEKETEVCMVGGCCSQGDVQRATTYSVSSEDTKREILEHFIYFFRNLLSREDTHEFDEKEIEVILGTLDCFERSVFFGERPHSDEEWRKVLELREKAEYDICNSIS